MFGIMNLNLMTIIFLYCNMRELPILFSTPMVQAILGNRKTMTRRTAGLDKVNENPDLFYSTKVHSNGYIYFPLKTDFEKALKAKPRYQVGDKLWVKETYQAQTIGYKYKADGIYTENNPANKWKPSLFMPKIAARIWLEVTGVRCERLQNITETNALNEGIERVGAGYRFYSLIKNKKSESTTSSAIASFYSLWNNINGQDSHSANPWVFVYEFKRIEN